MLQLLFTVAFSAVPLTLYIPPVRSLNLFVETMEDLLRESRVRLVEDVLHVRSLSFSGLFLLSQN
ncbi:F-box/WD repeat-containing protein [Populus alba x Populus x berolinensis]|nr:F-box/WD repeat-containing protein [Populus alba x Populus x berolinensis]